MFRVVKWVAGVAPAALCLLAAGRVAFAAMPQAGVHVNCVSKLRDVHRVGSFGTFASHYVFAGFYAYGEWVAGLARGQSLWDKRGTVWCKIDTGSEALDQAAIERYGIASWTAQSLIAKMQAGPQLAPPVAPSPFPSSGGPQHR